MSMAAFVGMMRRLRRGQLLLALSAIPAAAAAQSDSNVPVLGRWDLRVTDAHGAYPSWLEVTSSGNRTLVGRFVGRVGSARPVSRVEFNGSDVRFSIPPQWDRDTADLSFQGRLEGDRLTGTITNPDGRKDSFTASRAPALIR